MEYCPRCQKNVSTNKQLTSKFGRLKTYILTCSKCYSFICQYFELENREDELG